MIRKCLTNKSYLSHFFLIIKILLLHNSLYSHKGHQEKTKKPAEGQLRATIVDSVTMNPMEYVSVSLIDTDHREVVTGGVSNKNGELIVSKIPPGEYIPLIEFIGYKTKELSPINLYSSNGGKNRHDIGIIKLAMVSLRMDAIDVLGGNIEYIQKIDKKIFNVGENLALSGGSGTDALRQIPNIDVSIDGTISLSGDENVTILIDGKKSGRTGSGRRGEVGNINASMIEKIEIITNPSSKYDPDGAGGVINIFLKRGYYEGFNGNMSLMSGQRGKQNISSSLNYRKDKINLFSSVNYFYDKMIGDGYRNFKYEDADRTGDVISVDSIFQDTRLERSPKNLSFRLGSDLFMSNNSTFGYVFDFANHKDLEQQKINNIINTIDPKLEGENNSKSYDEGMHWDHVLSYVNNFDLKEKYLKAYISYSDEIDDVHQHGRIDDNNYVNNRKKAYAFEENNSLIAAIDYRDLLRGQFLTDYGVKVALKNFVTDLNYLKGKYKNKYSENIYAAYLLSQINFNKRAGLKIGSRFEFVNTNARVDRNMEADSINIITSIIDTAISNSPFNNPYYQIYPSIALTYQVTENQNIQFSFSKKVNRPKRQTLSAFPQNTQDISRLRNGNPYLKPEYSDVFEANYSKNSKKINFFSSFSYKNTENMIMWWDRDFITLDSTIFYEVITADNADKAQSLNLSTNFTYRPTSIFNLVVWAYGWRTKLSDVGEPDLNGNSNGIGYGSRLTVKVPNILKFELAIRGRTKTTIATGEIPANYTVDVGVQKTMMQERLSVALKVSDLFDTGKFRMSTKNIMTDIHDIDRIQYLYAERRKDKRFLSVVINYNLGNIVNKKLRSDDYGKNNSVNTNLDMDY